MNENYRRDAKKNGAVAALGLLAGCAIPGSP